MSEFMQHDPTPWAAREDDDEDMIVLDAAGQWVNLYHPEILPGVLVAVNNHARLTAEVARLREALKGLLDEVQQKRKLFNMGPMSSAIAARAALEATDDR